MDSRLLLIDSLSFFTNVAYDGEQRNYPWYQNCRLFFSSKDIHSCLGIGPAIWI